MTTHDIARLCQSRRQGAFVIPATRLFIPAPSWLHISRIPVDDNMFKRAENPTQRTEEAIVPWAYQCDYTVLTCVLGKFLSYPMFFQILLIRQVLLEYIHVPLFRPSGKSNSTLEQ